MTDVSGLRNHLLRRLYEEGRASPAASVSAVAAGGEFASKFPVEIVRAVVSELHSSGLVAAEKETPNEETPLKLTASGFYEAESLGGTFKTPALAKIGKAIRDHQTLGVILAGVGIVAAIAYPEIKERLKRGDDAYSECVMLDGLSGYHLDEESFYEAQKYVAGCRGSYDYGDRIRYENDRGISQETTVLSRGGG